MRPFEYRRPTAVADAVAAIAAEPHGAFLAGGTNLVDHMKLGVAGPDVLVDVTGLPLNRIETMPDGTVRIGATVRNSELAADPVIRTRFPVLAQALLAGASGQLRNLATTAGNLLQRTRCGYFQDVTMPCNKRAPGSGCAAVDGYHRYHAILGASPDCVAVHPSDMAVALAALDAVVCVEGPRGPRDIPVSDFYRLPGTEPDQDTVLAHDELITSVDLPAEPSARRSRYRKIRDRASFAFALVSVAAVVDVRDGVLRQARIALGGVAHKPWRATEAERVLRDQPAERATFQRAAEAELAAAQPLRDNAFKVPLARNALVDVLSELTSEAER